MPMIRMDTDQTEATLGAFRNTHQQLGEILQRLSSSAEQMAAAWEGAAQVQFVAAWQEWRQGMAQTIDAAQPIIAGIERERTELLEADQSSSFS